MKCSLDSLSKKKDKREIKNLTVTWFSNLSSLFATQRRCRGAIQMKGRSPIVFKTKTTVNGFNRKFHSVHFVLLKRADVFRADHWLDISRKTVRVASSRSYAGLISSIATGISSPSGRRRADRAIICHRLQVGERANQSIRLIKVQWSV